MSHKILFTLGNGEALHLRQVVPMYRRGPDDPANLRLVRATCHCQFHSTSAALGVRRGLEPYTRWRVRTVLRGGDDSDIIS